jgi:hypothetical protein
MGAGHGAVAVTVASWSLVVSALALLVAALTAFAQHRQGGRLARIEVDRRHDERQPRLELDYDSDPQPLLRFTNHGPGDLSDVSNSTVHKPPVIASYRFPNQSDAQEGSLGPVRLGEAMTISINKTDGARGGPLSLTATCRAGVDQWTIALRCDVPGDVTASIW